MSIQIQPTPTGFTASRNGREFDVELFKYQMKFEAKHDYEKDVEGLSNELESGLLSKELIADGVRAADVLWLEEAVREHIYEGYLERADEGLFEIERGRYVASQEVMEREQSTWDDDHQDKHFDFSTSDYWLKSDAHGGYPPMKVDGAKDLMKTCSWEDVDHESHHKQRYADSLAQALGEVQGKGSVIDISASTVQKHKQSRSL